MECNNYLVTMQRQEWLHLVNTFLLAGCENDYMDSVVQPGDDTQEVVRDTK